MVLAVIASAGVAVACSHSDSKAEHGLASEVKGGIEARHSNSNSYWRNSVRNRRNSTDRRDQRYRSGERESTMCSSALICM